MSDSGEANEKFEEIKAVLHIMKELKLINKPFRLKDFNLLLRDAPDIKCFLHSKWKLAEVGAYVIKYPQHFIVQQGGIVVLRNPDFSAEELDHVSLFLNIMMEKKMPPEFLLAGCFLCFTEFLEDKNNPEDLPEIYHSVHDFLHIHNRVSLQKSARNGKDAEHTEEVSSSAGVALSVKQKEYRTYIEKKAVNFFYDLLFNRRPVSVKHAHLFVHSDPEVFYYLQKYHTINDLRSFFLQYPEKFFLVNDNVHPIIYEQVSSPPVSNLATKEMGYTSCMEKRAVDFFVDLLDERQEVSVKQAHSFLQGDADLRSYLKKKYTMCNLTAFFQKYPEKFLLLNEHAYPLIHDKNSVNTSAAGVSENLEEGCTSNVDTNVWSPRTAKEAHIKEEKYSEPNNDVSIPSQPSLLVTECANESPKSSEKGNDNKDVSILNQPSFNANHGKESLMKSKETPENTEEQQDDVSKNAKTSLVKNRLALDSSEEVKYKNGVSLPSLLSLFTANDGTELLVKNQVTPDSAEDEKDISESRMLKFLNSSEVKKSLMNIKVACERLEEENDKKNVSLLSWLPWFNRNSAKESLTKNEATPQSSEEETNKSSSLLSWFSWFNRNRAKESLIKNEVTQSFEQEKDKNVSVSSRVSLFNTAMKKKGMSYSFELEEDSKFDVVSIVSRASLFNTSWAKQSVTKKKLFDSFELEADVPVANRVSLFNTSRAKESLVRTK